VPGLALVVDKEPVSFPLFESALHTMLRTDYAANIIANGESGIAIGYSVYPSYPLTIVSGEKGYAIVEGAVYDYPKSKLESRMSSLLQLFSVNAEQGRDEAEQFAASVDGDFNLILADMFDRRVLIVNDTLGRLQLFFRKTAAGIIAAREMKFLAHFTPSKQFDSQSFAEVLLFGWPLSDRTLVADVSRMPIGSSLYLDVASATFKLHQYSPWRFEYLENAAASYKPPIDELVSLFVEYTAKQVRWASGRPLIVSLSGGLDSRKVAAALSATGAKYRAVTFNGYANEMQRDVLVAEKVARILAVPWEARQLTKPGWEDAQKLVRLRDGLNYIGVSFNLQYLEAIKSSFGHTACLFTGDDGEFCFADLRTPSTIRTIDDYVSYRLSNSIWPIDRVSRLLGISAEVILERLRESFLALPDPIRYWNTHFILLGRVGRYNLEGEERNRSILWSMTPFASQSFFRMLMSVASEKKGFQALRWEFMRTLNADVSRVPYSNWNMRIGSLQASLRARAEALFPSLPRSAKVRLKRIFMPTYSDSSSVNDFTGEFEAMLRDPGASTVFSAAALRSVMDEGCNKFQFQLLITQLMYLAQSEH
jgi:asparagine synthase (glutamine-hydrolysing)